MDGSLHGLLGQLSWERWAIGAGICLVWMLSLSFHEFAHALVGYWGGDTSVKSKGYLTLNPLRYTDIGPTVIIPIVFLMMGGIALPGAAVYIDTRKLRNRLWESAVSAAGPFATGLFTFGLSLIYMDLLHQMPHGTVREAIGSDPLMFSLLMAAALLVYFHAAVLILNLLPVPGLDGFGIIEPWLPTDMRIKLRRLSNIGIALIFGILWLPLPNQMLWATAALICSLFGVTPDFGDLGYAIYHDPITAGAVALIATMYFLRRKDLAAAAATAAGGQNSGGGTGAPESIAPAPPPEAPDSTTPDGTTATHSPESETALDQHDLDKS